MFALFILLILRISVFTDIPMRKHGSVFGSVCENMTLPEAIGAGRTICATRHADMNGDRVTVF